MTVVELQSAWMAVDAAVRALALFPPGDITPARWEKVAAGEVTHWSAGAEVRRVVAARIIPLPITAVWLGVTDDHPIEPISGLREHALRGAWSSPKLLYQHIDLPWPFDDRQWVIELRNNASLYQRAGVWERSWTLADPAPAGSHWDPEALATPVNEGAWLMMPINLGDSSPPSTLAVYQARASLGGVVPEDAVRAWTAASLDELFARYQRNAESMFRRYGAGCSPQPGPDGSPLPCLP